MDNKFSTIQTPWRRLLVTILINALVIIGRFSSARARMHWVGHFPRPRRLERLLGFLLLVVSMIILEPHQIAVWSMMWGGFFAIFLNLYMIYRFVPRRYHWIK
jgi:hypothetical protein